MPSIALPVSLRGQPLSGVRVFNPVSLFAANEPGIWLDPSDLTTLFQDTAGTTPVTTAGQTVALALDKSKGLTLGPELVTNGTFDTDVSGWTEALGAGASLSWSSGRMLLTSGLNGVRAYQVFSTVAGRSYRFRASVTTVTAANSGYRVTTDATGGATGQIAAETAISGNWTRDFVFVATGSSVTIAILSATPLGSTLTADNISVRELAGNHATQATAASRPTYGVVPQGGRRNLLTYSEQFDNAAWVKTGLSVSANAGTAPDGTTTAEKVTADTANSFHRLAAPTQNLSATSHTLSVYMKAAEYTSGGLSLFDGSVFTGRATFDLSAGTVAIANGTATITSVGNGWYRCTVTGNGSATTSAFISVNSVFTFTGDGTSGILIWGAQLEVGSTATNYQRVVTAFDVTEAGVPSLSYLSFDGVDDFLVTPTITPNIDKAQVFAGVRKLTESSFPVIVETSTSWITNNGSFSLGGGNSNGYTGGSRGTVSQNLGNGSSGPSAPDSAALTFTGDISGDNLTLGRNGTQVAQNTVDQGTGNYLAYPMYIGRRSGTSNPFNGQLYSLIVRFGANLDANTITNTETWVNGRTGAY